MENSWRAVEEAWNSRLTSARLKIDSRKPDQLHVLSYYASMHSANQAAKDELFRDLDRVLSSIPSEEPYTYYPWCSRGIQNQSS